MNIISSPALLGGIYLNALAASGNTLLVGCAPSGFFCSTDSETSWTPTAVQRGTPRARREILSGHLPYAAQSLLAGSATVCPTGPGWAAFHVDEEYVALSTPVTRLFFLRTRM